MKFKKSFHRETSQEPVLFKSKKMELGEPYKNTLQHQSDGESGKKKKKVKLPGALKQQEGNHTPPKKY